MRLADPFIKLTILKNSASNGCPGWRRIKYCNVVQPSEHEWKQLMCVCVCLCVRASLRGSAIELYPTCRQEGNG